MKENKIIVGTNHSGYNQNRNFIGLPFENTVFKKKTDYCKLSDYIYFKITKSNHKYCHNYHKDFLIPNKPDLYHFFNTVSHTSKAWIVTHEAAIPRFGIKQETGLKLLSKDNCKKIISFCKKAQNLLHYSLEKFPIYKDKIIEKNIVIQPAQKLHINNIEEKYQNKEIIFTFTGTDFFRKGGLETVKVFDKLIKQGAEVHLNIISSLAYNTGWKDAHITKIEFDFVQKIIQENSRQISYYKSVPNNKVLEILRDTDIGLLPSYGETYGYTVLESQSYAAPVITTEMPPFEEFNNNNTGWLIPVPLIERDGAKTSDVYSKNGIEEFSQTLENNLYKTIEDILNNKHIIREKAKNAIENIRFNHDPKTKAEELEKIYFEACR